MGIFDRVKRAYTLAEIIIVLVVIAVVVAVTMRVAKTKLDNITTYTYYSAYGVLNDVTVQIVAGYDPQQDSYMEMANASLDTLSRFQSSYNELFVFGSKISNYHNLKQIQKVLSSEVYAIGENNWLQFTPVEPYGGECTIDVDAFSLKYVKAKCQVDELTGTCEGNWHCNVSGAKLGASPEYLTNPDTGETGWYCRTPADTSRKVRIPSREEQYQEYCQNQRMYKDEPLCGYRTYDLCASTSGLTWSKTKCKCVNSDEEPPCTQVSEDQQKRDYCQFGKTNYDPNTCTYLTEGTDCEKGQHWSSSEPCGCVPDNATVPRKGANFCEMFVSFVNTKTGESLCSGGAVAADVTDFSSITPDIVLRTGMRVFNASQNPANISEFTLADGEHKNSFFTKDDGTRIYLDEFGYTLYIDIDGARNGNSKLWEDVFPFYVTLSGKVIPAYNTDAIAQFGGGSRYYLQTSIQVDSVDAQGATQFWLDGAKSISFRQAACMSGYVDAAAQYCSRNPSIAKSATCSEGNNSCSIKKVSPIRWF